MNKFLCQDICAGVYLIQKAQKYNSSFPKVFKIFTHSTLKFSGAFLNSHVSNKLHWWCYLTRKAPYFIWPFSTLLSPEDRKWSVNVLEHKQTPWRLPPCVNKSPAPISVPSFGTMAVLPLWSCLLVSYFSVSLAELSNLSDLYPPLWEESPGQFSDYQVENGTYIIDPWVYTDRLGMYKILINKTATYFEKYAPENEQNILWGLPVQHGWQYRTGKNDSWFHSNDLPLWRCSNWEMGSVYILPYLWKLILSFPFPFITIISLLLLSLHKSFFYVLPVFTRNCNGV